ncbi:peptidoglycan-binding protein, partial [Candidatus Gracilibacteria bacterium]|nr:peptidoglycan-binding protein [Candidatus Gracilibacteria bacterium]
MLTPSNSLRLNQKISPEDAIAELSNFLGWNDQRVTEKIPQLKTKNTEVTIVMEKGVRNQRVYVSVAYADGRQSTTCIILLNSKKEENPIYIHGAYPVGTSTEYKEAERVKCLSDLERVGPNKPVGWVAIKSLAEVGQIADIEQYRAHLTRNGVKTLLLTFEESEVASGALFAYHEEALNNMLNRNRALLENNGWPTEPVAFIYYLKNQAPRGTDLFNFIADTFSDFNNDGRKSKTAISPAPHESFKTMSLPEKKKYLAEGINGMTRDLGRGMSGDDVLMLQNALLILGYMTVAPNGNFGPKTEDALARFKLANSLATDPNDIKTKRFGGNTKRKMIEMLSADTNAATTASKPQEVQNAQPSPQKPPEKNRPDKAPRNALLVMGTAAILAIGGLTHDKIGGLFKKSEEASVTTPTEKHIDEPPRDPNRPEFLDQK